MPKVPLVPSKCDPTLNMASNIKVAVRVRPLNNRELGDNCRIVVDVVDENMLVLHPKEDIGTLDNREDQQPNKNYQNHAETELKFVFDYVWDQDATNRDVFEATTKDMLVSLMEGYNCSVLVYGATGAGKSFTITGSLEHPGITYLTIEKLFNTMSSYEHERDFEIGVSYIEVYNENVFDLLKPSKTPLQLREDSNGVMVAGLSTINIKTAQEVFQILKSGKKNRTQHPTHANSRSHAVFQVYVNMRYKTRNQLRIVKLSMIDLAGSDRASATSVGDRFKEGAYITKSLLSLSNCINKLADGESFVPYRDSKLTRLLKDSLCGNSKTVMIANVSPSSLSYEDTYNTLKFAARAKKTQLSIIKSTSIIDSNKMEFSQLMEINEGLKNNMDLSQLVEISEELEKKVKELEAKLTLSNLQVVTKEPDKAKEQEWRRRLISEETIDAALQENLLALMIQVRILALREKQHARANAQLVHCSSTDAIQQICNEDIPHRERAAESYIKQSELLDSQVMCAQTQWTESHKKLIALCEQARAECPRSEYPQLDDLINIIHLKSEQRFSKAKGELGHKLLAIIHNEINFVTEYTSEMAPLLKKLYLTLNEYDKITPSLTNKYVEIIKKVESSKDITCSDQHDTQLKFISNLDIDLKELSFMKADANATVDIVTDSNESTDVENKDPVRAWKRNIRGTSIKLANNNGELPKRGFNTYKGRIAKLVVGKALPQRPPVTAPAGESSQVNPPLPKITQGNI